MGCLPLFDPTSHLQIPNINKKGRLPTGTHFEVEDKQLPISMTYWPQFHNGVSAALQIAKSSLLPVTQAWIQLQLREYKRKTAGKSQPEAYANMCALSGVLFGLGLRGDLHHLSRSELFVTLNPENSILTTALLLGSAVSHIESQDIKLINALLMHLKEAKRLTIHTSTQCASLIGLGLIFFKQRSRAILQRVVSRMHKIPVDWVERSGASGQDRTEMHIHGQERESFLLCAYLAIGGILMGARDGGNELGDLHLADFIEEGVNPQISTMGANGKAASTQQRRARMLPFLSMPGATIAMGLLYFKSGDNGKAMSLSLPSTLDGYERMKPDVVLLRCLSRGLIMWESVGSGKEWLEEELPLVLKLALKWDGTKSAKGEKEARHEEDIENDEMHAFACAIYAKVGLLFALAMKMIGSNDEHTTCEMLAFVRYLYTELEGRRKARLGGCSKELRSAIHTCIALCCALLGVVCSGTGRVDVMRVLRKAVKREDATFTYGHHMLVSMGMGFLFLSDAMGTLSQSDLSVYSLIMTLYPRLPANPTDTRYHLQALRHMWVLAQERRSIDTFSVVDGQRCGVQVVVKMKGSEELGGGGEEKVMQTPCVLPPTTLITSVEIGGDDYAPITLDCADVGVRLRLRSGLRFYVKPREGRRKGHPSLEGQSWSSLLLGGSGEGKKGINAKSNRAEMRDDPVFSSPFRSLFERYYSDSRSDSFSRSVFATMMEVRHVVKQPHPSQHAVGELSFLDTFYRRALPFFSSPLSSSRSLKGASPPLLHPHCPSLLGSRLVHSLLDEIEGLKLDGAKREHKLEAKATLESLKMEETDINLNEAASFLARLDLS
uniref:Anaphase-promoting complex subunit 1 n=1 Tax=Palpitomonas bilix TaxID=652834 RepID=A0A7S3DCJ1_9EUKA